MKEIFHLQLHKNGFSVESQKLNIVTESLVIMLNLKDFMYLLPI